VSGIKDWLKSPFVAPTVSGKSWVVYCKPPFGSPEQVLAYLARLTP
jgi:hypothetical protein